MRKNDKDSDEFALLRQRVRVVVDERFEGNQTRAAKQIGISQSTLSEFLGGSRGAGRKMLEEIRRIPPR